MKRIMILAGGTATAWHLVNEIEKYYKNTFEVYICDINPQYLVPSSTKCKEFIQVLPISNEGYYDNIISILKKYNIDILVPLIDFDLEIFSNDNEDLKKLNVKSTAPKKSVVQLLSDKYNMSKWMNEIGINAPKIYEIDDIEHDQEYIIKPKKGFGSRGISKCKGNEINSIDEENYIIQELCSPKEVTVEVFKSEKIFKTICRERIEVKSGVCTKTRIYNDKELNNAVKKIVDNIEFPNSACIQFMLSNDNKWCVTDINLRLGAGTALV